LALRDLNLFFQIHRALSDEGELPATLKDAYHSLEMITAIYHSSETGQPIDLPLPKDHPNYSGWTPARYRR